MLSCPAAHCNRRLLQINVDRFSYGNLQFRASGTLSAEARRSLSGYNLPLPFMEKGHGKP